MTSTYVATMLPKPQYIRTRVNFELFCSGTDYFQITYFIFEEKLLRINPYNNSYVWLNSGAKKMLKTFDYKILMTTIGS